MIDVDKDIDMEHDKVVTNNNCGCDYCLYSVKWCGACKSHGHLFSEHREVAVANM